MLQTEEIVSVECTSTQVVFHELRLADKEVVKLLNECKDQEHLVDEVKQAIKIGLIVLQNSKTIENIDYVEKCFMGFNHKMDKKFTSLEENVDEYFGPKGLIPGLFDTNSKKSMATKLLDEISKQIMDLLNVNNDKSSIGILRKDLENKIDQLQGVMNQLVGKKEEFKKGSQKGIVFEEDLYEFLLSSTRMTGDSVEKTGAIARGRDKKGDLVITLNEPNFQEEMSIAVEAKDTGSISLDGPNGLISQVQQGMVNRNTDFGIGVVKNIDSLPNYNGPLRYYREKSLIICGFGEDGLPFELAYFFARMILVNRSVSEPETDEIDIEGLEQIFGSISGKLKTFRLLKKNMSEIEKITGQTRTELSSFEDEIKELVQDGLDLLLPDQE